MADAPVRGTVFLSHASTDISTSLIACATGWTGLRPSTTFADPAGAADHRRDEEWYIDGRRLCPVPLGGKPNGVG